MCSILVKISFIYLKISLYFLYFAKFNQNVLDHPIHGGEGGTVAGALGAVGGVLGVVGGALGAVGGVLGAVGGALGAHLVRRQTSLNLY